MAPKDSGGFKAPRGLATVREALPGPSRGIPDVTPGKVFFRNDMRMRASVPVSEVK